MLHGLWVLVLIIIIFLSIGDMDWTGLDWAYLISVPSAAT